MLFLMNDRIVDVPAPEAHIHRRWRTLGCGEPTRLLPDDVMHFAQTIVRQAYRECLELEDETIQDLAALIITVTGANATLIHANREGGAPRLARLPEGILMTLKARSEAEGEVIVADIWQKAA